MSNLCYLIFRHSQKTTVPECPLDTVRLWTGYSLLNLHGNARASGQELGSTGSCMQRFSTMPVVRCDINEKKGNFTIAQARVIKALAPVIAPKVYKKRFYF